MWIYIQNLDVSDLIKITLITKKTWNNTFTQFYAVGISIINLGIVLDIVFLLFYPPLITSALFLY